MQTAGSASQRPESLFSTFRADTSAAREELGHPTRIDIRRNVMKHSLLAICFTYSLAVSLAQAQSQTQAAASGASQSSVSASRSGAAAQNSTAAAADASGHGLQGAAASGTEMNATLSKPVDAGKAKPGDEVTALATDDMKSNGQVVVPKGSKLIGHVTSSRPHESGKSGPKESGSSSGGSSAAGSVSGAAGSELGIVFDKAILRGGREVPLHAAIQAIGTAETASSVDMPAGDFGMSGAGGGMAGGRAGGGGMLGGVGGTVRGAAGATSGLGATASSTLGASSIIVGRSAGAVGNLNSTGGFVAGSRGAFGLKNLDVTPPSASGEGSLVTSSTQTVRLDRGTRMLLVTGSESGSAAAASNLKKNGGAAATTSSADPGATASANQGSPTPKSDAKAKGDPDRR